ncbi:MAG: orotate phosphoribosyltransferase [Candidatus Omnitrophica bacterium]|nr:orotate phosphoribosyltransferase [Candidatus Omnitrophota bacterium]
MLQDKDILELFKKSEALLSGHFELTSGLHSNQYFQCALVLQYPNYCELLAKGLKEKFADFPKPDKVIGPALGGVTLAYELARSVKEVIELIKREGAEVIAVGSVVNRSSQSVDFGVPFRSLIKMEVQTYQPSNCPLCEQGIPVYKPGSKALKK